jgi:hypothetical protein
MILFRVLTKKLVKAGASQFQNLRVDFLEFHALFSVRLLQFGYAITRFVQDGSENSHACAFNFFLERYHKDGTEFLNIVRVTGDKTSVSFVNVETKEQSKWWIHTHSPTKPTKFNQKLSASKLIDSNCFLGQ